MLPFHPAISLKTQINPRAANTAQVKPEKSSSLVATQRTPNACWNHQVYPFRWKPNRNIAKTILKPRQGNILPENHWKENNRHFLRHKLLIVSTSGPTHSQNIMITSCLLVDYKPALLRKL